MLNTAYHGCRVSVFFHPDFRYAVHILFSLQKFSGFLLATLATSIQSNVASW